MDPCAERVSYLGPEGSYSMLAARQLCPQHEPTPLAVFPSGIQRAQEKGMVSLSFYGAYTVPVDLHPIQAAAA